MGTDVHTVMYFQMKDISENTWERFDKMFNEAEQYINHEFLSKKEDRKIF